MVGVKVALPAAALAPRPQGRGAAWALAEKAEEDRRRLVGDRQGLDAQLLLGLQGLQLRAFLRQVRIDDVADAGVDGVLQLAHEVEVRLLGLGAGAELGKR